jgi:hypothetical protein
MSKPPLAQLAERFGDKEKLVAAVQRLATEEMWLDRVSSSKGLARVSNAKLLRLFDRLSFAKKEFGSRAKLIDAILEVEKRGKDAGYRARLERWPVPRLLDHWRAATRRAKRAAGATTAPSRG